MRKLTKKDIALLLTLIAENYNKEIANEDIFNAKVELVYSRLNKYPYEVVNEAVAKCFDVCKYNISIADIIEQINLMRNALEKTDMDLWAELDKAIYDASVFYGRFGYTAVPLGETKTQGQLAKEDFDRLFEGLDPLLQDYVHDRQGLLNLINCDLEYEKGRFLKAMPNLRNRQRTLQETPISLLKELKNALKTIDNITEMKQIT